MKIRTVLVAAILVCVCSVGSVGQSVTKVPKLKQTVMVDGKIGKGEWDDAAKTTLSDAKGEFARVYIKQSSEYIWFAFEILRSDTGTLDLYLSSGDAPLADFHASAKLGQRIAKDGKYPEEWTWWNNEGWVANVSRVQDFEKRTFMPENVREYQIAKSWVPGNEFRLMYEAMTKAEPTWNTTKFPEKASSTDPKDWYRFRL